MSALPCTKASRRPINPSCTMRFRTSAKRVRPSTKSGCVVALSALIDVPSRELSPAFSASRAASSSVPSASNTGEARRTCVSNNWHAVTASPSAMFIRFQSASRSAAVESGSATPNAPSSARADSDPWPASASFIAPLFPAPVTLRDDRGRQLLPRGVDRQGSGQLRELGEGSFQLLDDLGGEDAGGGQRAGVVKGVVAQPCDVEVGLIPRH